MENKIKPQTTSSWIAYILTILLIGTALMLNSCSASGENTEIGLAGAPFANVTLLIRLR